MQAETSCDWNNSVVLGSQASHQDQVSFFIPGPKLLINIGMCMGTSANV